MDKKLKTYKNNNKYQKSTKNSKKSYLRENSYKRAIIYRDNNNFSSLSRNSTEADHSFFIIGIPLAKFNKNRVKSNKNKVKFNKNRFNFNYSNFSTLGKFARNYLNFNIFNSLAINFLTFNFSNFYSYNSSIVEKIFSIVEKISNFFENKKSDFSYYNESCIFTLKFYYNNFIKKFTAFCFNIKNNIYNSYVDLYIKLMLFLVFGRTILYQFVRNGGNNLCSSNIRILVG